MFKHNWLIVQLFVWAWSLLCYGHVRLLEVNTRRSIQLFPQLHWQIGNQSAIAATYCEPTDLQQRYEFISQNGRRLWQVQPNHLPRTAAGEFANLRNLCLDEKGLPIRLRCLNNASVAVWQHLNNETLRCRSANKFSQELHQLSTDKVSLVKLRSLLSEAHGKLTAADVYSTATIVAKLVQQANKTSELSLSLISICQHIMSADKQTLALSAELNSTNKLLSQFEQYMDALPQELCGQPMANSMDMDVEAISVKVLRALQFTQRQLLIAKQARAASGIACSMRMKIWKNFVWTRSWRRLLICLHRFGKNCLLEAPHTWFSKFMRMLRFLWKTQLSRQPSSQVLSISIPGFELASLPEPVPFLLRNPNYQLSAADGAAAATEGCGYWNYGTWLSDGVTTSSAQQPNVLCHAQHLTQFSFLVGGSYAQLAETELAAKLLWHEQLLDTITYVGCGLSLFGLLGIFLTAVLVKQWRSQASTKVLLHLCLALSFQLLLFGVLGNNNWSDSNWQRCLFLGAALQYSVLVIFHWMLIIAYLQFQRYVTVIGVARPQHYILYSALVAWILPFFPTLLVVIFDADSFKPSAHQFKTLATALCYPSGYSLALGVLLPVALIIIANAFMLLSILYSVYRVLHPRRQHIIQQMRLSVLLFFLLGLSWIFGLCTYMQLGLIFSYLFCLTATLQGFVLFVYFVLLSAANRHAWLTFLCPIQMKMNVPQRHTELQSMSSLTTSVSKSLPS
ncbi:CG11318 [Drosophila busckii]|uniref:CG11318 n=1 Tax=Drosophila busckii TaxID=30019 RepID=A0A0M5J5M8_DROBS|nr:CG11318 [Drosophila busckii]